GPGPGLHRFQERTLVFAEEVLDRDRAALAAPDRVQGQVRRDLEEPGLERPLRVVGMKRPQDPDKSLLRHLGRVLGTSGDPPREVHDRCLVPAYQLAIGALFTREASPDQVPFVGRQLKPSLDAVHRPYAPAAFQVSSVPLRAAGKPEVKAFASGSGAEPSGPILRPSRLFP